MLVRRAVKLLDFGLAARTSVARPQMLDATIAATMAPTLAAGRPQTAPTPAATSGLVGTIQYMAPERLDGQEGDHRADIFAFGCVLYEMIAGRKAFEGGSVLTAIAAIKSSEPPPVAALQAQPLLDRALRRCLAKDPEERWQSIRDVTSELRWIAEHSLAPSSGTSSAPRSSVAWRMATGVATVVAIAAIAAAVQALRRREAPADLQPIRFRSGDGADRRSVGVAVGGRQEPHLRRESEPRSDALGPLARQPREPPARGNRGCQLSVLVAGWERDRILRGQ